VSDTTNIVKEEHSIAGQQVKCVKLVRELTALPEQHVDRLSGLRKSLSRHHLLSMDAHGTDLHKPVGNHIAVILTPTRQNSIIPWDDIFIFRLECFFKKLGWCEVTAFFSFLHSIFNFFFLSKKI